MSRAIYWSTNAVVATFAVLDIALVVSGPAAHQIATRMFCEASPLTLFSERLWPAVYGELSNGICRDDALISYDFWRLWRASMISLGFEGGVILLIFNIRPLLRFFAYGRRLAKKHPDRPMSQGRALTAIILFTLFIPCCFALALPTRLGSGASNLEGLPALVLDTSIALVAVIFLPNIPAMIIYYLLTYTSLGSPAAGREAPPSIPR